MTTVHIKREPLTYSERGAHSFFVDITRSRILHDDNATERLERHRQETERSTPVALETREGDVEFRVNPNTTTGTGGEFAPPLWMIEKWGSAALAGRVLGDVIGSQYLPPGVSSVHVPRVTAASTVAVQTGQGSPDASTDETTSDVSSSVVTISGHIDASIQLYEQTPSPGFDMVAYTDLTKSYNKALDLQLLAGTGTGAQLLGLTNVTGRNTDTSGASATTIATLWPLFGQAAAAIGNNRLMPLTHWFMAPRRWAWIASSVDSSNRPIASPSSNPRHESPDFPMAGNTHTVGTVLGRPVWEAGAITAGNAADYVVGCRPGDFLLFESDDRFTVNTNPLSGTLQVRLQLHRYVAFIPHRYPSSISVITNIPQPANF